MAATCEISNIFSTYFSTMYNPEDPNPASAPPAAAYGADNRVLSLSSPQVPLVGSEASWLGAQPQFWSKAQVLDWVAYQVEKSRVDASTIDFSRCDMDGAMLCSCAPEDLRHVFGPLGDQLYTQLWNLTSSFPDELSWIIDLLEKDSMSSQETLGGPGPFDQGAAFCQEVPDGGQRASPCYPDSYGPGAASPGSSDASTAGTATSQSPHASDSGGSDVDLDLADNKAPHSDGLPGGEKGDPKLGKRRRGRPRKLSKDSPESPEGKKGKHAPRGTHLWEFIRDILIHPELNQGLMKWEDRREGVFKFLRSEAVAQLWGQKKKNSSMTYEKLSRAMRYYYKREILERVDGRRLVYKFGRNSSGWREEELAAGQH